MRKMSKKGSKQIRRPAGALLALLAVPSWAPLLLLTVQWNFVQYKLEATPEPSDEDEDESEEEEEDDDMFGGGKGADDPAAQAASEPTDKQNV